MNNHWVDAAAVDALPDDEVIGVDLDGKSLALYKVEGAVFATDNICTHGHARLCDVRCTKENSIFVMVGRCVRP